MSDEKDLTTIINTNNSEFASDLLRRVAELANRNQRAQVNIQVRATPGQKGEIVSGIVIHLVGSVVFELLKIAAEELYHHPRYDQLIQLNINGNVRRLEDIPNSR